MDNTHKEKLRKKFGDALLWCAKKLVRAALRIDRYVVKRYLNIETPLYKFWWALHVRRTQTALDSQRK